MTRIEFWSAVMGLLVATVVMFNQMNGRIDQMNGRIDRFQAETGARFDTMFDRMDRMQAETNARFDAHQAKTDTRFDAAQVENARQHDDLNRRFDELFEVLRAFEGRISRLEGRLDSQGDERNPGGADARP